LTDNLCFLFTRGEQEIDPEKPFFSHKEPKNAKCGEVLKPYLGVLRFFVREMARIKKPILAKRFSENPLIFAMLGVLRERNGLA